MSEPTTESVPGDVPSGTDYRLEYSESHIAWPRQQFTPEITVSRAHTGGGVHWEFTIEWKELGKRLVPLVRMFNDSWAAYLEIPALFVALAEQHDTYISPDDMAALLDRLGFHNATHEWATGAHA